VVHAGWRGLLAGVIGRAILMMTRAYGVPPADLLATIGPAIGPKHYEVSRELAHQFLRDRVDLLGVIWTDRRFKPRLDLRLMAMKDLLISGVPGEQIDLVGPTTDDPRCFSHRRDRGRTGRQLAAVLRAP
jgi:copper oxidase (laccase) domain-containing protein